MEYSVQLSQRRSPPHQQHHAKLSKRRNFTNAPNTNVTTLIPSRTCNHINAITPIPPWQCQRKNTNTITHQHHSNENTPTPSHIRHFTNATTPSGKCYHAYATTPMPPHQCHHATKKENQPTDRQTEGLTDGHTLTNKL